MVGTSNYRKKVKKNDPSFSRKKGLDFLPVQRKINFSAEGAVGGGIGLIDVARCGSMINRRLMRQGKLYTQKLEVDPTTLDPGQKIEVWVLKSTWPTIRAWELAKENFDQSYADERENISKSNVARYFDFRVDHGLGAVEELVPRADNNVNASGGVKFDQGEFILSSVEDQNGVIRTFTWANVPVGNQYSIFTEYAETSRAPKSPAFTTGDGPYDNLHADSSAAESESLQADGNSAPYASTMINNGNWVKIATLAMGAAAGRFSTQYFDAPCGLIALRVTGLDASQIAPGLSMELKSGDYKGVRAHNMQRM